MYNTFTSAKHPHFLHVFVVLIRGGVENSLHILSALLAAAAPFSALLSFAVPFATVVKSTRKAGAVVAGWGGADDICFTDGVCVTDDDLFPPGMLRLSGVKVYDGASPENAIKYTASLILSWLRTDKPVFRSAEATRFEFDESGQLRVP